MVTERVAARIEGSMELFFTLVPGMHNGTGRCLASPCRIDEAGVGIVIDPVIEVHLETYSLEE